MLWREQDCTRNAVESAARAHFSHHELYRKSQLQMKEMLASRGVRFEDYPAFFKRGTYIQRRTVVRRFSPTELEKLPPKHHAHRNPELQIERSDVEIVEMPPLASVPNRDEVVCLGACPVM